MNLPSPLRRRSLFALLSLSFVLPFVVAAAQATSAARSEPKADGDDDSIFKYLTVFTEVLGLVRNAYVEPTEGELLMANALDGTVDALDPFAAFAPASAAERFARAAEIGTSRSGLRLARERGVVFVATVDEGSPAATAGIASGDILAKLDGASSRVIPLWEIEARFAAADGTKVDTDWIRRGENRRAELVLGAFAAAPARLEESRGVPVLHLPRLEAATVAQARTLLASLAGRQPARLLIDLRGTTGGDPKVAFDFAALFADGELGRLEARDKTLETFSDRTPNVFTGQLVVLVDRSTLGPAELLAGILRRHAGARLVGEHSFGYTGRQEVVALSDGSHLRLATAFYTIGEAQKSEGEKAEDERRTSGLKPDLVVDELSRRFGEKDEPLSALILRKGVALLLGEESLPEKKPA